MLVVVPCTLSQANEFIRRHHRTHQADQGGRLVFGVAASDVLVGIVIVGRPRSRSLQRKHPLMAEVTRCCTDGTFDAASKLYAQAWVAARAIGYRTLITYTLPAEGGPCLRALKQQGWRRVEDDDGEPLLFGGTTWDRPPSDDGQAVLFEGDWGQGKRRRIDKHLLGKRWRWEVSLAAREALGETT